MTPSPPNPELQALVSEDCRDLLSYLINENIVGGKQVVELASQPVGQAALENVVLQIARAYAVCAFEQATDLDMFTPRIQASLDAFPGLVAVVRAYQGNVDLAALNEDLSAQAQDYQSERLEDYLGQFLPERLG